VVPVRAKDALGAYGEQVAERHLVDAGLTILERNWRCDVGEIDIVAREGDVLVVCEVKTRSGTSYGTPLEGVTPLKAARLRRLAGRWLAAHAVRPAEVRIDIVGVLRPLRGPAVVEHVRGAV
jgi:putative endonuclease